MVVWIGVTGPVGFKAMAFGVVWDGAKYFKK